MHKTREHFGDSSDPVQDLWTKRAIDNTEDLPDQVQKNLEVAKLLGLIESREEVLDAGCGNGLTTRAVAGKARRVHGLEYTPLLFEKARRHEAQNLTFSQGDIRRMTLADASFDTVYTQRVLINLMSLDEQEQAIREVRRVLRPGGKFLMLETSREGIASLNQFRSLAGLSEIKAPWHNLPIDESALFGRLNNIFHLEATVTFGVYFFLSRIVQPLYVAPALPSFDHPLNSIAADLEIKAPIIIEEMSQIKIWVMRACN